MQSAFATDTDTRTLCAANDELAALYVPQKDHLDSPFGLCECIVNDDGVAAPLNTVNDVDVDDCFCNEWLSCSEDRSRYKAATPAQKAQTDISLLLYTKCERIVCGSMVPTLKAFMLLHKRKIRLERTSPFDLKLSYRNQNKSLDVAYLHIVRPSSYGVIPVLNVMYIEAGGRMLSPFVSLPEFNSALYAIIALLEESTD